MFVSVGAVVAATLASALGAPPPPGACAKVESGVCLNDAKPILRIIKGTHDPGACCASCWNLSTCVSWNVNREMNQCFLRAVSGPTNPGAQCISGQTGREGPPPPHLLHPTRPQLQPSATSAHAITSLRLSMPRTISRGPSTTRGTSCITWGLRGMSTEPTVLALLPTAGGTKCREISRIGKSYPQLPTVRCSSQTRRTMTWR